MLPLRYLPQWRVASVGLLLAVLGAMLMPAFWSWPDRNRLLTWFMDADKWLHLLTFAVLAIWFAGLYQRRAYWRIAIGLLLFGILTEGCQRLVTYRSAEWYDIVADAVGIVIGLGLAATVTGEWSLRVESWYLRRKAVARVD